MQTSISLITTTDQLAAACDRLAEADYVTVDTEFMRESTFWPKLCLIQLAGPELEVVADPLVEGLDLTPFFALMANERVVKVFHAARQDIEIVYHLARIIPHPIFDTQLAAMVCGFGESASYGALVRKLLRRNVDKSSRFTDWARRPLSGRQLAYALGDVTHLRGIYVKLKDRLEATGRAGWLAEEMAELTDAANYDVRPEDAWRRLKMRVKTPQSLAVMMEVAAWRERQAQAQNVPRGRVLKDDAVYDLANQAPRDADELGRLRTISEGFARSGRGRELLAAVERGLARDMADVPPLPPDQALAPAAIAVTDLLRVLLKAVSARHGVAAKLIATTDELEQIALDDQADVHALHGWRRELFGEDALALKAGRLALAVADGEIVAVPTPGPAAPGDSAPERRRDTQSLPRAFAVDDAAARVPVKS